MTNLKKVFYTVLNILMLCTLGFSLMIYTSLNSNMPWHEACGTQFLAIFLISDPILIIIFGGFLVLKATGYEFQRTNFRLPLYILLGLSLPLIIDGGLGPIAIYPGITVCILSIAKIIIDLVNNLRLCNKLEN